MQAMVWPSPLLVGPRLDADLQLGLLKGIHQPLQQRRGWVRLHAPPTP